MNVLPAMTPSVGSVHWKTSVLQLAVMFTKYCFQWLLYAGRCSIQSSCQQSSDPRRWLQSNNSHCIVVSHGSEHIAPITRPTEVCHTSFCLLFVVFSPCITDFSASDKCPYHWIISVCIW